MSAKDIDKLLQLWAATLPDDQDPPFADHGDLYSTIDATALGDVPWESFSVTYDGDLPEDGPVEAWKQAEYKVYFRDPRLVLHNQLANADFKDESDWAPKQVFDTGGKREYCDFMSGNWAWGQAVCFVLFFCSSLRQWR